MSWKTVTLGEVCSIVNGGTPKSEVKDYWDGELNWITPKEMGKLNSREISSTERKITELGLKNSSARLLPINSVILSSRAPIGHLAINKELMATNQGCKGLVPSEKINFEYLYYFLNYSKQLLNDMGSGATFKELSGSKLATVKIPLPSLATQQKIVAKLDAIFAEIDKATAAAEANAKNAEALFQSYLTQVFERGGEGWKIDSIRNICEELFAGGDVPKERMSKDRCNQYTIPIFTNGEKDNGLYGFTDNARVTKPSITVSARGTIGYSQVRDEPFYPAIRLIVATPNPEIVLLNFLKYAIKSIRFIHSGASIPQLTVPMIRNYSVALPSSMEEQQRIIKKIDALSQQIEKLKFFEESKAKKFSLLKQSILKQAFAGELVKE